MRFYVKGQTLSRSGKEIVATEAINFPIVEFEFDSSWDGINVRTAVFQNVNTVYNAVTPAATTGQTPYAMVLENDGDVWKTHVPYEILDSEGTLKFIVTVYGGTSTTKLITTNAVTCEITHSLYDPGQTPGTPTPSVYDQLVDSIENVTNEVVDARTDTLGAEWSSLGNAIRGQVNAIKARYDATTDEVVDARTDTLGAEWSSLGNAIRGQVNSIKNSLLKIEHEFNATGIMQRDLIFHDHKKWGTTSNGYRLTLEDDATETCAVEAYIVNNPTKAYIRGLASGSYYLVGPLHNNTTNIISHHEGIVGNNYTTIDLTPDVRRICFQCLIADKDNLVVLCSNETYGMEYDAYDNTKIITNKILGDICTKTQDRAANTWTLFIGGSTSDDRVIVSTPREYSEAAYGPAPGDIVHIEGYVEGANDISIYSSMNIGASDPVLDPQYYYRYYSPRMDSTDINNPTRINIDVYTVVNKSAHVCILECAKSGNNGPINALINITRLESNIAKPYEKYSVEICTGKKWVNGEYIYSRTYDGYYESTSTMDVSDMILDNAWNYKYTIIDSEINFSCVNSKSRYQTINPGLNYKGSNGNNKPVLNVMDSNGGGHSSSTNAMLTMTPSIPYSMSYPWGLFYTVTVFYIKNTFTIAPEVRNFEIVSSTQPLYFQDTGKSFMLVVESGKTVIVQTKNHMQFDRIIQTFDKTISSWESADFTIEFGLYVPEHDYFEAMTATLNSSSDDWYGVTIPFGAFNLDLPYLRYVITNNGSSTHPIAIGPMMLSNVRDEYIDNI